MSTPIHDSTDCNITYALLPVHSSAQELQQHLLIKCPGCEAPLTFGGPPASSIDSCGFENYHFRCDECRARFAGVVDPSDGELLLSDPILSDSDGYLER